MSQPTILELCCISGAVYGDEPELAKRAAQWGWSGEIKTGRSGFQAGVYKRGQDTVVAFRGTTKDHGDWVADLKLGVGMNTSHFAQGDEFLAALPNPKTITLCGHSLGGAIAQVAGNRAGAPFATFNAPGVAVLASRNIWTAAPPMLGARMAGALASAVLEPGQALKDIASTFYSVTGVNVCLLGDPVSQIGVHYGKVFRLAGLGHGINNVVAVLDKNPDGAMSVGSLFGS
jgi:pimeloyl-ACP methyl ester carboxylesterase